MRKIGLSVVGAACIAALAMVSSTISSAGPDGRLTVVELFTSQSCYSCPPAEAFLGELVSERADVLALEFHVDYWDDLVYGSAGRWKDIFSSHAYTERQLSYNKAIRGRPSVYTPQMVIDGREEAVGTRRSEILSAIGRAALDGKPRLEVSVEPDTAGGLLVRIEGPIEEDAAVWLVRFQREATTRVLRGENHGKTLTNHNIVKEVSRIADWDGRSTSVSVRDLDLPPGDTCAVLVQPHRLGRIFGAAICPATSS
ncbi:MAG: DUF1223 domain-containing protein [Alphaproteobacteria bacterium]